MTRLEKKRRAFLIKKEYDFGLTQNEKAELEELQLAASQHRNQTAPIDRSQLDASIRRLKRLGQWKATDP